MDKIVSYFSLLFHTFHPKL